MSSSDALRLPDDRLERARRLSAVASPNASRPTPLRAYSVPTIPTIDTPVAAASIVSAMVIRIMRFVRAEISISAANVRAKAEEAR